MTDTSPLSEANPNSFQELFERINEKLVLGLPEQIQNSDIMEMVNILRGQRKYFLEEQDKLGRAPSVRGPRKPKPNSVKEALDVDVTELEF